jgi:hypothetical protein
MMRLLLGPVLYIGRCDRDTWRMNVQILVEGCAGEGEPPLVVRAAAPDVEIGAPQVAADLTQSAGCVYWRWPLEARRGKAPRSIGYAVEPRPGCVIAGLSERLEIGQLAVPARGELPRIAFFSCNGISSYGLTRGVDDLEALWKQLGRLHGREDGPSEEHTGPYHLLLGGGDQVYSDWMWEEMPELKDLAQKSYRERVHARPSPGFPEAALRLYVQTYVENWGSPPRAAVFARVPGLFVWDDHEIFDNWGSFPDEVQASAFYRALYRAAALCYEAFQLGGSDMPHRIGLARQHYLQALGFHEPGTELDILCLDLRSGRSIARVIRSGQRTDLRMWLQRHAERAGPPRHLLLVSTIPFVYMQFEVVDNALEMYPSDVELQGDLRDQWEYPTHRDERDGLILELLEHARRARCRITIVAGDVHVGGRGRITSHRPEHVPEGRSEAIIEQVISSGIVHPAPHWLVSTGIEALGTEEVEQVAEGVEARVLPASGDRRYLWRRNWLSIAFDGPTLCLRLMTEDGPQPEYEVEP